MKNKDIDNKIEDILKEELINESIFNSDESNIIFEQYKLYVQMSNELSNRRETTNKHYLTLVTSLFGLIYLLSNLHNSLYFLLVILIMIIIICVFWLENIKSYNQLNNAKFKVINNLEEYFPINGFKTEWSICKVNGYSKLTKVEAYIPKIFIGFSIILLFIMSLFQLL